MQKRKNVVIKTSVISIMTNICLSLFKALIGLLSHSVAIMSDSINNLSDAFSSIITIVGTKLALKKPDREHPYGHGRIEYITSLIVSSIVLYAGFVALIESIKKVINPVDVSYSFITIVIIVFSIITKLVLGLYVKYKGREVHSNALIASGLDAFNDAILSISVLISIIVYLLFDLKIEAYVGIILSIFIMKTGLDLIKESINNMVGMRVESKLSKQIKKDIVEEPEVAGAFDLLLHNYGPDNYIGSVHIEINDTYSVADIDRISRRITKKINDKYGILIHTIGVYSVNTKDKKLIKIRKDIEDIVFSHNGILEFHGFYIDKETKTISFDIIIDFKIDKKDEIYQNIYDQIKEKYSDYDLIITLDIDVSD